MAEFVGSPVVTSYSIQSSPVGALTLSTDGTALLGLHFARADGTPVLPPAAERNEDLPVLQRARAQLAEYFAGRRTRFDLPLAPSGSPFQRAVWQALVAVEYGTTSSYSAIANAIGKPRAVRAVGQAIGANPLAILIPCHRIVGRDGSLTGFAGGLERKATLLAREARTGAGFDAVFERIDTLLFDLDGTVYLGNTILPGAVETLRRLRADGKQVFFLSNNSSRNKGDYVRKLAGFGIPCEPAQIVLSTDGTIEYLLAAGVRSVCVVGTASLVQALQEAGIDTTGAAPAYVVLGYDTELSYAKLARACGFLNAGVELLVTHCDLFCPSEAGPLPDAGAMIEMIRLATGKRPKKVFGKPQPEMIASLCERRGLDPARTLIVGDRLHTDVAMARNFGCYGLLVLSGETTRPMLRNSTIQPDFVLDSIADLYPPAA